MRPCSTAISRFILTLLTNHPDGILDAAGVVYITDQPWGDQPPQINCNTCRQDSTDNQFKAHDWEQHADWHIGERAR